MIGEIVNLIIGVIPDRVATLFLCLIVGILLGWIVSCGVLWYFKDFPDW